MKLIHTSKKESELEDKKQKIRKFDNSEISKVVSLSKFKLAYGVNISNSYFFWMIAQTLIASIAFIALLPLFLVISIKILLEGRPVIYSQIRVGSFGKLFRIYKFRTMKQDAEKLGPFICQDYEDPRITKFGKFLRKSKLDELPQLINIIKNEMSFVGPRPERPVFHEKFKFSVRSWENRLFVRPGITGYAQVNRRINHDPNDKIIEDLKYIKEQSFITDIKIILKTLVALLDGKPI